MRDAGAAGDFLAGWIETLRLGVAEHDLFLPLCPGRRARQHFVKNVLRDHSLWLRARSRIWSRYWSFIALATFVTRAFPLYAVVLLSIAASICRIAFWTLWGSPGLNFSVAMVPSRDW